MKFKTLALIAASSAMTLPAFAADWDITTDDTLFGTSVSNTATLNYSIGSVSQTAITNDVLFNVDRKLVYSLTRTGTATESIDGNGTRVFTETYTIQNDSNAPIAIKLPASLASSTFAVTKNGAAQNIVDSGYQIDAGDALPGTFGDTLTITVTTTITDADIGTGSVAYDLDITAIEPTGSTIEIVGANAGDDIIITAAADEWLEETIQTVGLIVADELFNSGILRRESKTYTINKPILDLVKKALVIKDPITGDWVDGGNQPKAIPGSTIRYTLTVTNSGTADALGILLTDDLNSLIDKLTLDGTAISSLMYDGASTTPKENLAGDANLKATLDGANLLTFPAVDVPKNDGTNDGVVTATFEVVLK
jgi:uncharacterized repeat protein (TIGR01451 family)